MGNFLGICKSLYTTVIYLECGIFRKISLSYLVVFVKFFYKRPSSTWYLKEFNKNDVFVVKFWFNVKFYFYTH